jgi:hypothetical protein
MREMRESRPYGQQLPESIFPLGLLLGPPEALDAASVPPPRSLVPLAAVEHGFVLPCCIMRVPTGSFGDVDGCEWALGLVLGALVCARQRPGETSDSAAARTRYFMAFPPVFWEEGQSRDGGGVPNQNLPSGFRLAQ